MKDELRKKYKALRAALCGERRAAANARVAENFLKRFGRYRSFLVYNSFGSEAATGALVSGLLSLGKQVFLPRVEGSSLVAVPCGPTKKGAYGIEEPCGPPYNGDIEVTVIPLLAVNEGGFRLGFGGGYYDRYLKNRNTLRVGLGYAFQTTDERFEEPWDEPLHAFVCDAGVRFFGGFSAENCAASGDGAGINSEEKGTEEG